MIDEKFSNLIDYLKRKIDRNRVGNRSGTLLFTW